MAVNNMTRNVPVTLQQVVQAGSIGSHGNIPAAPTAGVPITSVNVPTNVGSLSRPGIGTRPIATPIYRSSGFGSLRNYPANPGIVIRPVGTREPAASAPHSVIPWGQM